MPGARSSRISWFSRSSTAGTPSPAAPRMRSALRASEVTARVAGPVPHTSPMANRHRWPVTGNTSQKSPPPASARGTPLLDPSAPGRSCAKASSRPGIRGSSGGTRAARSASLSCCCRAGSREFSRASAIRAARSSASRCTSREGRPPCGPPRMSSPSGPPRVASGKHQAPRAARSATPAGACAGTSAASGQERAAAGRASAARAGGARSQPRFSSQVSAPAWDSSACRATVSRRSPPGPDSSTAHHAASRGTATCPATARIRSVSSGPASSVPASASTPIRARRARSSPASRARSSAGAIWSASCCSRRTSVSVNCPGRAAATASTPVTWPSTINGTVETDGAVRSHAAGPSPLDARTPRSPSSSATRA